jgi:hypothetical protein
MFGYIKLDSYADSKYKSYFKQNYCFLCRALDKHYGFFSRLFVSYDVTFFCVLFSEKNYLHSLDKVKCFKTPNKLKDKLNTEFSKKVAALNLALAAGELKDNIEDKDKFYAKIAHKLYNRVFRKVKKEYPLMWDIIEKGHEKMREVEKLDGPIEDIEICFATLIEEIARKVFCVTEENKISIIKYIAKMLYFMDAVDDIDKDIKRNTYNGLKRYGSKNEYVLRHYSDLKTHLTLLRKEMMPFDEQSLNAGVVNRIIDFGIPETLVKICFKGV